MRPRLRDQRARHPTRTLDVDRVRSHFDFPDLGRIVTNNAATTQPPDELLALYRSLAAGYENVHRGQSTASRTTTALFEEDGTLRAADRPYNRRRSDLDQRLAKGRGSVPRRTVSALVV